MPNLSRAKQIFYGSYPALKRYAGLFHPYLLESLHNATWAHWAAYWEQHNFAYSNVLSPFKEMTLLSQRQILKFRVSPTLFEPPPSRPP